MPVSRDSMRCQRPFSMLMAGQSDPARTCHDFVDLARVVVEILGRRTAKDDDHFGRSAMPVDRQYRSRFKSIQHSLGRVFRSGPQIIVHPEPGRLFRLFGQSVKYFFVDNHLYICAGDPRLCKVTQKILLVREKIVRFV